MSKTFNESRVAPPCFVIRPRDTSTLERQGMTCERSTLVRGLLDLYKPTCRGIGRTRRNPVVEHDPYPIWRETDVTG
jgi:hypothetical protein